MQSRQERLAAIKARKDELRSQKSATDRELGQIAAEEKDLETYELEDLEKEAAAIRARLGLPASTVPTEGEDAPASQPGNKKKRFARVRGLMNKKVI